MTYSTQIQEQLTGFRTCAGCDHTEGHPFTTVWIKIDGLWYCRSRSMDFGTADQDRWTLVLPIKIDGLWYCRSCSKDVEGFKL